MADGSEITMRAGSLSPEGLAGLPPELAFIPSSVLPPAALAHAARMARAERVTGERALLAAGLMSADRYYRLLAGHLGLPFADRPLRPASDAQVDGVLRTGAMRLAPNPRGWTWLLAPQGRLLQCLLSVPPRDLRDCAVTAPDRLEALIRHEHRLAVAHQASQGLRDWNGTLSARGGLTLSQSAACTLLATAFCAGAWFAPSASLGILSFVFYCAFLLNASLRLLATAASLEPTGAPCARLPDEALPVYTVVVPLFREAREVERLTAALGRLDYPVLGSKLT